MQGKLNIQSTFDILLATLATPKDMLDAILATPPEYLRYIRKVYDIFVAYSFECRFSWISQLRGWISQVPTYCRHIRVILNIPAICRGFSFAVKYSVKSRLLFYSAVCRYNGFSLNIIVLIRELLYLISMEFQNLVLHQDWLLTEYLLHPIKKTINIPTCTDTCVQAL